MSNKLLSLLIGVVLVGGVGALVVYQSQAGQASAYGSAPSGVSGSGATTASSTSSTTQYTMADVAQHNSASSCWTVIDGNVYDLTAWIPQHPGGPEAIESICGIDGSTAFHNQHDHAARQENILATFQIGVLATQ